MLNFIYTPNNEASVAIIFVKPLNYVIGLFSIARFTESAHFAICMIEIKLYFNKHFSSWAEKSRPKLLMNLFPAKFLSAASFLWRKIILESSPEALEESFL